MKNNSKLILKHSMQIVLLLFLIVSVYILSDIVKGNLELKEVKEVMEVYLYHTEGYHTEEIKEIKYKYSFSSKPFGYDPYHIDVIFTDEPTVIYSYVYRDSEIIPYAVGSTNGVIPKNLKH